MKNKKNIILILFSLIILLINFCVGPNLTGPYIIFNLLYLIITILYIIKNYKKTIIFFNNKIDYIVLFFMLSSFIPLIFKKYVSLNSEYNCIMQNLSILSIYILTKNLSLKEKNNLLKILIYGTIPVVIIAFDRLNTNLIWNIISNFNFLNINYDYGGLLANFNYPNSLAIFLSSIFILLINQITKEPKNIIHKTYFTILFSLIILTKSKAALLISFVFIITYLLFLKNKDKKIILNLIIISSIYLVLQLIILNVFNNIYLKILFEIILFIILLETYFYKMEEKNINYKKIFIILSIFILIVTIYSISMVNYSKTSYINGEESFEFANTKNKKDYNIKIDLNGIKNNNNENNFIIKIYAIYKDGSSKEVIYDTFEQYSGIKSYTINDDKKIYYLRFTFENLDIYDKNEFIIKNIYINEKKYIINYKYLPNKIGEVLSNFSLKDRGLLYRLEYFKTSIKILEDSWLFGNGANSWNYLYKENQSYSYSTSESHSYLIDTFIDFGIVAFILLIILYYILIKYFFTNIKNKYIDKTNLSIIMSILIILLHSIVDFNMSFLVIKTYVFILIAILSNEFDYKINAKNKKTNILYLILLFILLCFNLCNIYGEYNYKKYSNYIVTETNYNHKDNKEKYIKKALIFYPTNKNIRYQYFLALENEDLIKELLKFIDDEKYYRQLNILSLLSSKILLGEDEGKLNKDNIDILNIIIEKSNIYDIFDINYLIDRTNLFIDIYTKYYSKYKLTNDEYYLKKSKNIYNKIVYESKIAFNKNKYKNQEEVKDYKDLINNFFKEYE